MYQQMHHAASSHFSLWFIVVIFNCIYDIIILYLLFACQTSRLHLPEMSGCALTNKKPLRNFVLSSCLRIRKFVPIVTIERNT
jgi:hypothetical protein